MPNTSPSTANITIFSPSTFFILVQTHLGLQLQVQLVPLMQVFVRLDPSHRGQMCGEELWWALGWVEPRWGVRPDPAPGCQAGQVEAGRRRGWGHSHSQPLMETPGSSSTPAICGGGWRAIWAALTQASLAQNSSPTGLSAGLWRQSPGRGSTLSTL
jgi:hypothetical protein